MSEGSAATEATVSLNPIRKICLVCGLLVGALIVIALIAYAAIPPLYEARSEFTLGGSSRPPIDDGIGVGMFSGSYEEIFRTRLSMWRSEKVVAKIVQAYRVNFPASTTTDQEIIDTLSSSGLEVIRHSRLIAITVRSTSPQLAAALADAYVEAIKVATDEENRDRCDHAIREIVERVQKQRRVDEDIARRLMNFRSEHNIDAMKAKRAAIEKELQGSSVDETRYRDLAKQKRELDQSIISADASLGQLRKEQEVSTAMLEDLMMRENEARVAAENNIEVVAVLKRAEVPTLPANVIPKLFWILTGGLCYAK